MTARISEHGLVADVEVLKAEVAHCAARIDEYHEASQEVIRKLDAIEKEKSVFRVAMATELGEIKTTLASEFGKLRETMAVQDDRYKRESGMEGAKWGGGVAAVLTGIGFALKEWFLK